MKIGIIGAGHIAEKIAKTLIEAPNGCRVYAVASRSIDKAKGFCRDFNIPVAYGSYEELVDDSNIDLIYIATPHSLHFNHAKLALTHNKPCLVEKSFTLNSLEAAELIKLSHKEHIFIGEAIWTRYLPITYKIKEVLESGIIGSPKLLSASLCYNIMHKERVAKPELGGGVLLDLGVYLLNFARIYFGLEIESINSNCVKSNLGVDIQENISIRYKNGNLANLQSSGLCYNNREGIISGSDGFIRVNNVNCPTRVEVYRGYDLVDIIESPKEMITGYEYQFYECKRCLEEGLIESNYMPHSEILAIMQIMDNLRDEWGIKKLYG